MQDAAELFEGAQLASAVSNHVMQEEHIRTGHHCCCQLQSQVFILLSSLPDILPLRSGCGFCPLDLCELFKLLLV